jgi:hypothetical protein
VHCVEVTGWSLGSFVGLKEKELTESDMGLMTHSHQMAGPVMNQDSPSAPFPEPTGTFTFPFFNVCAAQCRKAHYQSL